ncbi:MAG: transcriptional repressor [Clostridia bacterium]|nr:transcriptional repressor [Clostridia bacterium]
MSGKVRKYSRKREAIREVLMGTESHPTAEWIYGQLKPEIPDLSLATVYRNLGEMKQNGEIQSVAFWGGKERFDGNVAKHSHFVCDSCGKIDDFHFIRHDTELDNEAQKHFGGRVDFHTLVFHGTCNECIDNDSQ